MPDSLFTLSDKQRLKDRFAIAALFQESKVIHVPPIRILYRLVELPQQPRVQAAFAVPKRIFHKAHERNHLKRLMRESFRLQQHILNTDPEQQTKVLQLLFLYNGRQVTTFNELKEKFQVALIRLKKELERDS